MAFSTLSVPGPGPEGRIDASAARGPASLLDPRFDHDSCGVGFVASALNRASHEILQHALTALGRLAHRGAVAADGLSSDGIGVMTGVPRALLLADAGKTLADDAFLGLGMLFIPQDETRFEAVLEAALDAQQLKVFGWRDVPTRPDLLGSIALSTMPKIRQVLVVDAAAEKPTPKVFERRLYLARKAFERAVERGETTGYVCSLSSTTVVYKAMCLGKLLVDFYPDLKDTRYVTTFAVFHQRYATNTLPAWHRAQPGRRLGHNGEINTVWGNRAQMDARMHTFDEEIKPVLTADGTDSTSLDETIELLSQNGFSLAKAVRITLPPAILPKPSPFIEYHRDLMEPWDGPAAISFSDGRIVGAALDRNGLRPARYAITTNGLVVAGSEAGLVDLDPEQVVESGRLGPGQMMVVDMIDHKVLHNEELLAIMDTTTNYPELLELQPLEPVATEGAQLTTAELLQAHKSFGYTKEDLKMILQPMAASGKDAVWSMGDDTPLAFLARSPRPLYHFFRQRFAQVTNPPIDSLRESIVISMHTRLGPWPNLLGQNGPLPGISLPTPFLSLGQMAALRAGRYPHAESMPLGELCCCFLPTETLEEGLEDVCRRAEDMARTGTKLLILSDRKASAGRMPIPMAMAVGAVERALIVAGLRTEVGIAVEAGDVRDLHHAAVLIGLGAGAVCPWLMFETARTQAVEGIDGEKMTLKALEAGLAKVMSKMGISVVDSYRGAHLFDILGLHQSVVDRCFYGTPAPLSGIGFAEIERRVRATWHAAEAVDGVTAAPIDLIDPGWVRFRKSDVAEPHHWQPSNVKSLQTVVGSARGVKDAVDPAAQFRIFTTAVEATEPTTIRDLFEIRPAGPELQLSEVQPPEEIVKKFIASAMSLGSLSPEAHQTITAAMNMLGARSNTGEGGEDPDVYSLAKPENFRTPGGGSGEMSATSASNGGGVAVAEMVSAPAESVSLNNKIKQIASGRFGVTAAYLAHAEEIEIKVAQGAKPGEGGQLPGHKVSGLIARLRHAQPGVSLISPPPHHDIYSIEDLAQLIYDLKRVNPRATVGVKLVSSFGVGTVAAGVAKAYADYVVIAGNTGGTGAAALSSIKYAGSPWELGLAEAQQSLMASGVRDRVRLRTDGGLATARDVLIAALLGADEFAFGTAVLVAIGCDMARQCHLNTCPTGIATQKPELRAKFRGKPEHIVTFFKELAADVQRLLAKHGLRSLDEATGRVDLLEQVRHDGGLDLTSVLAKVNDGETRWTGARNLRPTIGGQDAELDPGDPEELDEAWTAPAIEAVRRGEPFHVKAEIYNAHRAVGARLSGELALLRAKGEVDKADVTFELEGTAGQSFGAFSATGIKLILTGQANDFVGKGLSGAELVMRAVGRAAERSSDHVLLGNVALYGATAGKLLAAGRAGERFCVRNSGATAVVEGIGDHGCEYMTGGHVVILGPVGVNFGAGMTGGTAWIWDADGSVVRDGRYHGEFLGAQPYSETTPEQQSALEALLKEHADQAHSTLARQLLESWAEVSGQFVLFTPKPQA